MVYDICVREWGSGSALVTVKKYSRGRRPRWHHVRGRYYLHWLQVCRQMNIEGWEVFFRTNAWEVHNEWQLPWIERYYLGERSVGIRAILLHHPVFNVLFNNSRRTPSPQEFSGMKAMWFFTMESTLKKYPNLVCLEINMDECDTSAKPLGNALEKVVTFCKSIKSIRITRSECKHCNRCSCPCIQCLRRLECRSNKSHNPEICLACLAAKDHRKQIHEEQVAADMAAQIQISKMIAQRHE